MNMTIQNMIDNAAHNEIIVLPSGEFEGPFRIKKSCTIKGKNTTLWAENGPVIIIEGSSNNIYLKNLKIEITGPTNDFSRIAIDNKDSNLHVEEVYIDGNVAGYAGENKWIVPKSVNIDFFAAEKNNTFILKLLLNSDAELISNIEGINVFPTHLRKGLNCVTLETNCIHDKTCIYGEIIIKSNFIRHIFVSGLSRSNNEVITNKNVFDAEMNPLFLENFAAMKLSEPINFNNSNSKSDKKENYETIVNNNQNLIIESVNDKKVLNKIELQRGQRISLKDYYSNIKINFYNKTKNIAVDTYAFQLASDNKVINDECLIFFGNEVSIDESIRLNKNYNSDEFLIDLTKNNKKIEKIHFVCSVYNEKDEHNDFSLVEFTEIYITVGENEYFYKVNDISNGESMIALELYRYKDEWKVRIIASEIHKNILNICTNYGVTVD